MKTVYCPVKGDHINGTDCITICDIADGLIKPSCLPDGIEWNDAQIKTCKACKYHEDIEQERDVIIAYTSQLDTVTLCRAFIMPERRYRRDTVDSQKAMVMEKPQLERHTAKA